MSIPGSHEYTLVVYDNYNEYFGFGNINGLSHLVSDSVIVTIENQGMNFFDQLLTFDWFYFVVGLVIGFLPAMVMFTLLKKGILVKNKHRKESQQDIQTKVNENKKGNKKEN